MLTANPGDSGLFQIVNARSFPVRKQQTSEDELICSKRFGEKDLQCYHVAILSNHIQPMFVSIARLNQRVGMACVHVADVDDLHNFLAIGEVSKRPKLCF